MTVPQILSRPREIVAACAKYYGVAMEDVLGDGRQLAIVKARHAAMLLMRSELHLSYPQIGRQFLRDHTTALYAVRHIEERIACGGVIAEQIAEIRTLISRKPVPCTRCERIDEAIVRIKRAIEMAQGEIEALEDGVRASAERRRA